MASVSKRIFTLLIISTAFFSVGGVIIYKAAELLPISYLVLLYALGGLFGILLLYKASNMNFRATGKAYLFATANAAIVAMLLYVLFFSYTHYDLAQIYPFLSLSVMLFFAIDLVIYRRRITNRVGLILLLGIIAVIFGAFLAGSSGFAFNYTLLPFIILFILLGAVSDYLYFYKMNKYTIGSKVMAFDTLFFVLGIMLVLSYGHAVTPHPYAMAYAIFGGFAGVIATAAELMAMSEYKGRKISRVVAERNFINNFTYLDTVFVLIGSIIIGSFTYREVLGGVILVAGVIIISMAREQGYSRGRR